MVRGSLLALDLGSKIGWAMATAEALDAWPRLGSLEPGSGPIEGVCYGTVDMSLTKPVAARFCRAFHWLFAKVDGNPVTCIYYEAALPARAQSSIQAGKIALGLAGLVQAIGWDHEAVLCDRHPSSIKKHFTGKGNAEKVTVLQACRRRGWAPDSEDCGDALALLDYAAVERLNGGPNAP
jgi:Holliday junction resolvasome RuvABC endonuclease subunit